MRCPVCKTECELSNVCHECGFSEVGKVFVNQDDAKQWLDMVVAPYREKYSKANILPPIDWLEFLKQNPQAKRLFEFSIPVFFKRRAELEPLKEQGNAEYNTYLSDVVLEHIAFVSPSELVRKSFINTISDVYLKTTNFKRIASDCVEQPGDLAAVLTNLSPGDALLLEINSKIKNNISPLLVRALQDFSMEILIGKGPAARSIELELPFFTTILIADSISAIPADVANTLGTVIEINPNQDELNEFQIRETARVYDIQLTKATVDVITEAISNKAFKSAKSILKFISDYLYLHTEIQQPLSENALRDIIKQIS